MYLSPKLSFSCRLNELTDLLTCHLKTKTKLRGPSPRANYTDRENAACRRSEHQLLRIQGAMWSAWRTPTAVFSVPSRPEPLLFLPSSSSIVITRLSGPRSRAHYLSENLVASGMELWPLDHRGGIWDTELRLSIPAAGKLHAAMSHVPVPPETHSCAGIGLAMDCTLPQET
jgi:hypothetical protein